MRRVVIVGASLAGLRAAQAARTGGFDGELVVVGEEVHRPYTRPPLSKELLAGEHEAERVVLPSDTFDAQWRLGVPATRLDRARRRVVLADGDELPYDRLILATGSRARRWPGPGGELEGVHVLRSLDDALALRAALERRPRVVVVGAGFIGCEVAQTARKQGLDVTLIDIAPTPMLPLGPQLGEWCAALHRDHGVDVRLRTGVAALHGAGRIEAVELTDGTRVDADLVVVGMGAQPNTEWLADSGLQLTPGLECDATLTAVGDPDILGAGDIVSWPHPLAGGEAIRIEHWTVAAEQGQQAGRNVLLAAGAAQALRPAAVLLVRSIRHEDPIARPTRARGASRAPGGDRGRVAVRLWRRARRTAGRRDRDQRRAATRLLPDGAGGPARLRRPARRHRGR